MKTVFVDTSIFIDFSRTKQGPLIELNILASKKKIKLVTNTVVVFEFWSGKSMNQKANILSAQELFKEFEILDLNKETAMKAGTIRRKYPIDAMDALIAATSVLEADYLATLNTKHFQKVPGLKLWPAQKI